MKVGHKMNDELTNLAVVDTNTGEFKQYLTISEKNYLKKTYTSTSLNGKLNDPNRNMSDNEFNKYLFDKCGNFYFNHYNQMNDTQYEFRFIYLCTFMNYKGYLEYGESKGENKLITKKDLFEMLKLSSKETYNTINYLTNNNMIIIENDRYIKINDEYSSKGQLLKDKKEVVRMFNKQIRELYENALPKEHKKLGLLVKLLPMIHYSLNIICDNPKEENIKLIRPYNFTEVATMLGYSTTQKFKKGLMDIKVNGEPVIMISTIDNRNMIIVNPKIYYKGGKSNFETVKGLINLFELNS